MIKGDNNYNNIKFSIIEGIGVKKTTKLIDINLIDDVVIVDDNVAIRTVINLIRQEGILAGLSGGANVYVAIKVVEELGENKNVITIIPDNAFKYINVLYENMKSILS